MEKEQGGEKNPGEFVGILAPLLRGPLASRGFLKTTQLFFHFAPATNLSLSCAVHFDVDRLGPHFFP